MINFTSRSIFLLGVSVLLLVTPIFSEENAPRGSKLTDKEISISGKDLFEVKFNIQHYNYNHSALVNNFLNGLESVLEEEAKVLFNSRGLLPPSVDFDFDSDIRSFGIEGVLNKNLNPHLDAGVALGIGLYSGPTFSMVLTSGGDYMRIDSDFDHTQLYLSPYLSLRKEFEISSWFNFIPASTAGGKVAYHKTNAELSFNSNSGIPGIAVDEEVMSEFDVYPFIDFGCELWMKKLCIYPSLGYQKDLIQCNDYNFRKGLGLYYVWGIYDSVYFRYSTSSSDEYDKKEFQIGASISFL